MRLAKAREMMREIAGNSWQCGLIKAKINEIAKAESREKDESLPCPVWANSLESWEEKEVKVVISRVTAKRIYLKEIGGNEVIFSRETGLRQYTYGITEVKLNVKATIDTWNAHAKSRE